MKTIVSLSICLLFPLFLSAQLKEVESTKKYGEIKRGGYSVCAINYVTKGEYSLIYWDASFRTIDVWNSISFLASDEELNSLRTIFKNQLGAEKNSTKEFGLGDNLFKLVTKKAFGVSSLMVYVSGNGKAGYFVMNEKELNELFPTN